MAQPLTTAQPAPASARARGRTQRQTLTAAAYLTPALLGIVIVNVLPIFYNLYMSFTNRNGPARFAEGKYKLVGFDNYTRLLTQSDFYIVLAKTLLYAAVCVALFFVVGLAFALILNHPAIRGRAIWRTLMILPWAVPTWITALIWKFLFHGQYGPINQILRAAGIAAPDWLLNAGTAFAAITIVNLWMSYPFFMLILLGGLQSIPADMYEAASIDGASWWRQLFSITLPLLRPVALPAVILSAIAQFQMFNTVWLMTKGGPVQRVGQPGATELLLVWAYNQGFQGAQRFGLVSAFAIVVFIILLGITALYIRVTNATKGVYE
ncbi:MAG TPA: sugar ABC transporter permease [Kouleothrix sp.]|mgnify:CR=1 FL=1|uniref:carbohydrate ABC transporter permease n=1 Tax=Kouleothrix sp. TaxID=2779161 RepID=UPI002BB22A8E|nr:sugar ABC transporter permease [Kouleothrix sp.]HRC76290.1 sugar ABC transporter permease [Kouleothrix sp.]